MNKYKLFWPLLVITDVVFIVVFYLLVDELVYYLNREYFFNVAFIVKWGSFLLEAAILYFSNKYLIKKKSIKILSIIVGAIAIVFLLFQFRPPRERTFQGYLIWKREGVVFVSSKDMVYDLPTIDKQVWVEENEEVNNLYDKLDLPDKDNALIKTLVSFGGRLYTGSEFGHLGQYNSKIIINDVFSYLLLPTNTSLANVSCEEDNPEYCQVDEDCICTQEWGCFVGNKNYYFKCEEKFLGCDDFCGMSSDAVTRCVDNQCTIVYEYD